MQKLLRGSRLDELPIDQLEGTWRNARNIVITKKMGSITNEDGVDDVTPIANGNYLNFPTSKKVIGVITLNITKIFFFGTTTPSDSEIGLVTEDNQYQVILKGNPLNFNQNFPIQGTFENKYNGNLVIGWTDNYNKIRILNIDCIPFTVNADGTIPSGEQNKANILLSLFSDFQTPIINRRNLSVVEGAGALLSGVYHLIFSYGYEDGSFTNWSKIYNAIPVYVDDKNLSNNEVGGCEGGLITNKYIKVTIDNIDPNYKYLKIGYLYLKNGQLSCYEVKTITLNNLTSYTTNIQGNENSILQLSNEEVLIPNIIYEKCKTLTNLEKVLHLGNLKEPDEINFQRYANEIVVNWHRGFVSETYDPINPTADEYLLLNYNQDDELSSPPIKAGYKNETTVFFDKSFKSNEVYALYIKLRLKNGLGTKDFHIPGRDKLGGELTVINGSKPDYDDLDNGNPIYLYQTEDTTLNNGGFPREGIMGYWENEDEKYPLDETGLAVHPDFDNIPGVTVNNRNVRHHVFPSLSRQCDDINTYFGFTPGAGSPGEFAFSAPTNYYRETRVHTSVAPTNANYYNLDFAPLAGSSGSGLWTYTPLASPSRAQFDTFLTTGKLELFFSFKQDLSKNRVGQNVFALNGYWSIRLLVQLNGGTYVEYFAEISDQVLTSSTIPDSTILVNLSVGGGDTVVVNYEIYTSLGTATFVNPFTYDYFFASLRATLGDYQVYGKPLGLKISNVNIPANILHLVDSWEIMYAKRSNENIRIIAQDMLKMGRFYNFDLMSTKLPIKPSYLRPQLRYQDGATVAQIEDIPEYELTASSMLEIPYAPDIDSISKFQYVGENTTSIIDNSNRSANIYCVAGNGQITNLYIFSKYSLNNVLTDICVYRRNVYMLFQEQELLATGINHKITASGVQADKIIFGGDVHICAYGFRDRVTDQHIYQYVAEFASNVTLRRDDAILAKTYFPKNSIPSVSWFGYNRDFNCNNPYNSSNIHYPVKDCLNTIIYHPNRIARSIPESTESKKINWRTFKANAYYDTIRNKGEVWNLLGGNRTLYIALKHSLLKAIIKDKIATNSGEVYLGYTDIFDRPPYEVLSINEGFGGNQSQFATILCKIGYCFIDRNQGKVFVENGDRLTEISAEGYYNFFKDNSEYNNKNIDNPFIGIGYTMAFDEQYKRLIITKNTSENLREGEIDLPFTLSFSPDIKGWICPHDYLPNFILFNRSGLYGIANSNTNAKLFKHNSHRTKCIFYDGQKKESYVEFVDNREKEKSKGFENINWISNVNLDNKIFAKETITHLIIYNEIQCSGKITLDTESGVWFNQDARNTQQTWNFNNFRDIVIDQDLSFLDIKNELIVGNLDSLKEWFEQSKFISKFIIVRLIFDNISQKEVNITLVGTNAKISNR